MMRVWVGAWLVSVLSSTPVTGWACDYSNPESVAASFSNAVLADDFHAAVSCIHPHERAVLFMMMFARAGELSGVFIGNGGSLTDYNLEPETVIGKEFLSLVKENGIGLGKYQHNPLGEEASNEQILERFLDIAGPDVDAAILALDRFLIDNARVDFGEYSMSMLVKERVSGIQGGSDTMQASMGRQQIEIVNFEGEWYIAKAWALTMKRR